MGELVPTTHSRSLPSRAERQKQRALECVRADQQVAAAEEAAKVEVIAEVTETALLATSHVSAIESALADRVPHAEGRLRQIANAGALGMTDVVVKTGRKVQ